MVNTVQTRRFSAFITQLYRKESFAFRVFKIFFSFTLSMAIVLTFLFVHYQTEKVREDLNAKGRTIAALLANSSRVGVFAENRELLNDAAEGVMSQSEVLSVEIYSSDGKELLKREAPSRRNKPPNQSIEFTEQIMLDQPQASEDALYFRAQSGKSKEVAIGQVKVVLDASMVAQDVRSLVVRNSAIAGIILLIGSACLAIALKRVLGPLSQLTEEVKLLGEGRATERISITSEDEVGRLATAFNDMAENLKKRDEEARTLETQLRHAQKMEAIGTLARGIAHDFNNILTTVQASLYIMQKKIDKEHLLYNHVSRMNNSISRAKTLIQSLLTFSSDQAILLAPVEINTIIAGMGMMIRGLVGEEIEYSSVIPETPLTVMADSVQLERVVMNLVANARDSMPEGGTLSISVSEASKLEDHGISRLGRYAMISVTDSGHGIGNDIKERIFEPFFTTKEVGKGIGLGLSIVYGVIEQHRGVIVAGSGPSGGAEFRIYLPLFEKNEVIAQDIIARGAYGEDSDNR